MNREEAVKRCTEICLREGTCGYVYNTPSGVNFRFEKPHPKYKEFAFINMYGNVFIDSTIDPEGF